MYSELLGAAIKKIKTKDGELQEDDSKQWNNLAASLLERKRKDLALHLAETAANIEEDDPYPVVAWANILRKIDQSELLESQPTKSLRYVEVWLRSFRRLPREITSAGILPHATKKIRAPTLALLGLMHPVIPGNAHRDCDALWFDARRRSHVRVELTI